VSRIATAMKHDTHDGIMAAIDQARAAFPTTMKATGDTENPVPSSVPVATEGFGISGEIPGIAGAIAHDALVANVKFQNLRLQQVMQDLYNDAGLLGSGIASESLGIKVPYSIKDWTPGSLPAAQFVTGNGGLKNILDQLGITLKGIEDSAIDRMSTVLADGLNQGLSPSQIAKGLNAIIMDEKRAELIARTESSRAQMHASMWTYRQNGTTEISWHANAGACSTCIDNDANSPYPIDNVPAFPAHPNERCTLLAAIQDFS